ncbi:hypothetical protein Tco_0447913 [Tanacetum coccineum]
MSFVGSSAENATDGSTMPGFVCRNDDQKGTEHVFSLPLSSRSDFVITRKKLIHNSIDMSKKPSLKPSLKSGIGYVKTEYAENMLGITQKSGSKLVVAPTYVEQIKSITLKTKKESSDDETLTSKSDDEEYAMAVRNFKSYLEERANLLGNQEKKRNHSDKEMRRKERVTVNVSDAVIQIILLVSKE